MAEKTQQNEELYELLACLTVTIGAVDLIVNDSDGKRFLARLENDMARLNAAYEMVKETLENDKVHTN